MSKSHLVVDIDGTLANCDHRVEHAQSGDWETFHSLCHLDTPYQNVIDLVNRLAAFYTVVALTGRNEKNRMVTTEWLKKYCPVIEHVMMRADGDFRPDIEIKIEALEDAFGSRQGVLDSVICVIDDRDKLVAALRDYGLTVLQPREGAY